MADSMEKLADITKAHRLFLNFDERKSKEADLHEEYARECTKEHLKIARLKAEIRALKNETEALKSGDAEYVGRILEEDKELQLAFKTIPPEAAKKKMMDRIAIERSQYDAHCFEIDQMKEELFQLVLDSSLLTSYDLKAKEMLDETKDFPNDSLSQLKECETVAKNLEGILGDIKRVLEESNSQHRDWLSKSGKEITEKAKQKNAVSEVFQLVAADTKNLAIEYRKRERKLLESSNSHQTSLDVLQKHLQQLKEQSIKLATLPQFKVFKSDESSSEKTKTDTQVKKLLHDLKKIEKKLSVPQISDIDSRLTEMLDSRSKLAVDLDKKGNLCEELTEEIERGHLALAKIQEESDYLAKNFEKNKAVMEKEIKLNDEKIKSLELENDSTSRFIIQMRHCLRGVWDGIARVHLPNEKEGHEPIKTNITPFEDCEQIAKAIEIKYKEFMSSVGEPESIDERERNEILIDHAMNIARVVAEEEAANIGKQVSFQ